MLWAWERPDDLRFVDVRKAGVAFLAPTIFFDWANAHMDDPFVPRALHRLVVVVRYGCRTNNPDWNGQISKNGIRSPQQSLSKKRVDG
ncbi:MAG: hypothetical protein JO217_09650 [Acidobacteriaceae bacterium]|nr:hypothetical protein [Acidobacteriaceae bacterium]